MTGWSGSFCYFLLLTYSIGNTSLVTSHSTLTWWFCCLMFGSYFHIWPSIHIFVSLGYCIILICLTWWLSRLRVVFTSLRFHYPCCRCTVCINLFGRYSNSHNCFQLYSTSFYQRLCCLRVPCLTMLLQWGAWSAWRRRSQYWYYGDNDDDADGGDDDEAKITVWYQGGRSRQVTVECCRVMFNSSEEKSDRENSL